MKKLSQLDEKGLLKREKICILAQIASLVTTLAGLGFIFASIGMDLEGNHSLTQVLATLGTGTGLGILGSIGTSTCVKIDEKISNERIRRKEFEGFAPYIEEDEPEVK